MRVGVFFVIVVGLIFASALFHKKVRSGGDTFALNLFWGYWLACITLNRSSSKPTANGQKNHVTLAERVARFRYTQKQPLPIFKGIAR